MTATSERLVMPELQLLQEASRARSGQVEVTGARVAAATGLVESGLGLLAPALPPACYFIVNSAGIAVSLEFTGSW